MGIYTDLSALHGSKPRVGLERSSAEQLLSKATEIDPTVTSAYAAQDEVSVIPEQTDAGVADTYTITVNLPVLGTAFTTAAIAFNAVDTVIETAIDAATPASITDGHISVSMGGAAGLDDGTVTLTFDGLTVNETPAIVSIAATGFTATEPVNRSTPGQTDRKAAMALVELNVISGLWNSGEVPSVTRPDSNGQSRPRWDLIKTLALQAAVEDGIDDIYDAVIALYPRS